MEAIHGVDVSWLHRPTEGQGPTSTAPSQKPPPPPQPVKAVPVKPAVEPKPEFVQPPPQQTPPKSKRPGALSRASSEKSSSKSSWMSSLSSKFSSSDKNPSDVKGSSSKQLGTSPKNTTADVASSSSATASRDNYSEAVEEDLGPSLSQSSKSGSFFSSALRRLSPAGPPRGPSVSSVGSVPSVRQTLNIDQDRERCTIEELDQSKLRRVAFRVDVEIMGGSKFVTEPDVEKKKSKDKFKEKGEGEALKHPELLKKEMEANEKEEAASRHKLFEAEKPSIKLKDKSEGEALKHLNAAREAKASETKEKAVVDARKQAGTAKEDTGRQGKTAAKVDSVAKVSLADFDDLDDLDPFYGGRRRSSDMERRRSEEAQKLRDQKATMHSNDSHDHLDHLDPFGGSMPSRSKPSKPKSQPARQGPDPTRLDPFAQKKNEQKTAQQRRNDFDDMDDLDPYGGGKRVEKPAKPIPKRIEEDDDDSDSLGFFYKTGPPRDKAPSQWGVDLEQPQSTQISADAEQDPSDDDDDDDYNDDDDEQDNSLAPMTTNEQEPPTAETTPVSSPPKDDPILTGDALTGTDPSTSVPYSQLPPLSAESAPDTSAAQPGVPSTAPSEAPRKTEDRPTTDPLRVYRRCCQLREAPVLKRISEQLANAQSQSSETPGTINTLNLNSSRMQLTDIVCLADWLAIVPVKKLTIEDANLTDEGLRVLLAGLLAAKVPDCKRKRGKSSPGQRRDTTRCPAGVIERLSLKNNRKITADGWMHLCLFLNMSKTIQSLDVSMIPFPPTPPPGGADRSQKKNSAPTTSFDIAEVLRKSLTANGAKNNLRELLIAECGLSSYQIGKICAASAAVKLDRLGLASNHIDQDGLQHVARYLSSGVATGLDLGGNDLHNNIGILTKALAKNKSNPLWALSVANCNLTSKDLDTLLTTLIALPDVRLLDLSHNENLFAHPDTLSLLRKYLPKFNMLKRIHLGATSMTPAHAIGLAEVIPECRNLCQINVLDNPQLKAVLVEPVDSAAQEEAAAVFASMMTAVRLSKTMLCVDIDVPGPKASEIVKVLARQVVAYCLRNVERFTEFDAMKIADAAAALPDIESEEGGDKPLFMQHFLDGPDATNLQTGEMHGTNEDYIVGGTGVVKALNYCLSASQLRRMSTTPGTPRELLESDAGKATAKEMSKTLLESAYKFRDSLQPVLTRKTDFATMRRLQFLDTTLQGMIERFEQEYPDCRQSRREKSPELPNDSEAGEAIDVARSRTSSTASATSRPSVDYGTSPQSGSYDISGGDGPGGPRSYHSLHAAARRSSETSSAARALAAEEAQMHRMGQSVRREVMPPIGSTDYLHGTSTSDEPEPEHIAAFRSKIDALGADEIRKNVKQNGLEQTVRGFVEDAEKLREFERTDPERFKKFREAQMLGEQSGR